MSKIINQYWGRLATEAFVIIFSVLVALALDDWRDSREERELEEHLLGTLMEDLTNDLEELDDTLASAAASQLAASFLLGEASEYMPNVGSAVAIGVSSMIESSLDPEKLSEEQAAVASLIGGIDFDLSDLTYQEMMATGSFRVIRNDALRREIARYYWFVKSFNIANASAESTRTGLINILLENGVAPRRIESQAMRFTLQIPEVRAWLRQYGATAQAMEDIYSSVVEQTNELLTAVEAEISQ
jgi:hypothetical protein